MLRYCILCLFMVFYAVSPAYAAERLGAIMEVEGTVTLKRANGSMRQAVENDHLYLGDVVTTAAGAKAFVFLIDDTEFTLAENTQFTVSEYIYDPDNADRNKARYSALGAFRYVSGMIAKKKDPKATPDVDISTSFGSIGIRGTDFTVAMEGDEGHGVFVDEGSVNVRNQKGASLLKIGEGTRVRSRLHAPTAASKWKQARIEKMRKAVFLKRQKHVRQRVEHMRKKHKELRLKRQEKMQKHIKDKMQNRQNHIKEHRKGQMDKIQQKRQERFDIMKQRHKDEMLKRQEDREGKVKDMMEKRQKDIKKKQEKAREKMLQKQKKRKAEKLKAIRRARQQQ